jgi:hypothetical protein
MLRRALPQCRPFRGSQGRKPIRIETIGNLPAAQIKSDNAWVIDGVMTRADRA